MVVYDLIYVYATHVLPLDIYQYRYEQLMIMKIILLISEIVDLLFF